QQDDKGREYLYRGIAARQFQRTFVLADGIEIRSAELNNGLLSIDLVRHEPERLVRRIEIGERNSGASGVDARQRQRITGASCARQPAGAAGTADHAVPAPRGRSSAMH